MDMGYFTQNRTERHDMPFENPLDSIPEITAEEATEIRNGLSPEFIDALGTFGVEAFATMTIVAHSPGVAEDVKDVLVNTLGNAPQGIKVAGSLMVMQLVQQATELVAERRNDNA